MAGLLQEPFYDNLELVTKFFVASFVLLALVVGLVVFLAKKNPERAVSNEEALLNDISNSIDIATPTAETGGTTPSGTLGANITAMTWNTPPAMTIDAAKKYKAEFDTSDGVMTFDLYASEDPITVNNFVFLSQNTFYNNTVFHRIIRDFMVQGGDPKGNGTGGPGYSFADEPVTRDYTRGTLAMANSGPNTNGSQFFIMTADTPLPKNYTIFGKLTAGDDVLQKIAETPVTSNGMGETSRPTQAVTINKITVSSN